MRTIIIDLRDYFAGSSAMCPADCMRLVTHIAGAYSRSLCVETKVFGSETYSTSSFENRPKHLVASTDHLIEFIVSQQGSSNGNIVGLCLVDKQLIVGGLHDIEKRWRQVLRGSTRARV